MTRAHADDARFLCVYIQEAHAVDTWPFGLEQCYHSTHTVEERCVVARDFIAKEQFKQELLIDVPPTGAFNALFAAWPLRFYVLDVDGDQRSAVVSFVSDPFGADMNVSFVNSYLDHRSGNRILHV